MRAGATVIGGQIAGDGVGTFRKAVYTQHYMTAVTVPAPVKVTETKVKEAFEKSWNVIVWNDPINLMSYVVFIFMRVLGFSKEKATRHMLQVHKEGKSCVLTETREKAEFYHQQLQAHGLTVTLERQD